jgi:hypothetical protein
MDRRHREAYKRIWRWYHVTVVCLYAWSALVLVSWGNPGHWDSTLRLLILPAFGSLAMSTLKLSWGFHWTDGKPYTLQVEWVRLHLLLSIPGYLIPLAWPAWQRGTLSYWVAVMYMFAYSFHSVPPLFIALWQLRRSGCPHGLKKQSWLFMPVLILLDLQVIPLTLVGGSGGLGVSFLVHQLPLQLTDVLWFCAVDRCRIDVDAQVHPEHSMCPARIMNTWTPINPAAHGTADVQ